MEKQDIVAALLERGQLITPSALDEAYMRGAVPSSDKFIIDALTEDVKIMKNLAAKPKEADTKMYLEFYVSKYNKMKEIFTSRFSRDFVSLNKLDASRSEVSVFGIVKDMKGNTIELEDMTSSISVVFDAPIEKVERDDAIAVEGASGGKVVYGKKILFADIPIRQPTTGQGRACFVSDLRLNETPPADVERFFKWFSNEQLDYLFICGDVGDKAALERLISMHCAGRKVIVSPGQADGGEYPQTPLDVKGAICVSNPAVVEAGGLRLLMARDFDITMLRKRYLGRSKVILPEDFLVLDVVPDIVHCGRTGQPRVENYKSVSIVNSGSLLEEFKPVVIDFATRDVRQVMI
ncbi:MAG: metallophosphoesterase family protein [Candidatus Aenigmarchaeota archaeon]|nr:metallophosphoesterase family protein [Candidatus Aenigmarchaeota archaeon]